MDQFLLFREVEEQLQMDFFERVAKKMSKTSKKPGKSSKSSAGESSKKAENITYTEDNVPVRTLYVGDLKPKITAELFQRYFEKFGPTEAIKFHEKSNYKYAFVTFKKYEDAHSVLKSRFHKIVGLRLSVKPADTWHQPPVVKEAAEETFNENASSLADLNDDCLLHILGYFDIVDLLCARGICGRLDALIDGLATRFSTFRFEDLAKDRTLTLMIARDILQFIGPHSKSLQIGGDDFRTGHIRLLEFVGRFCTVLESLEIDGFQLKRRNSNNFIPLFKNLKSFVCGCTTHINEEVLCACVSTSHNLKQLTVIGSYDLTGKFLSKFKNLEVLVLNYCGNIQPKYFTQGLLNHKGLRRLEIQRCDKLNGSVATAIARDLPQLEELSISNSYTGMGTQMAEFGKIQSLRRLTIEFCSTSAPDGLLEKLVELDQLEELSIIGAFHAERTMKLVAKLKKLKVLKIVFNFLLTSSEVTQIEALGNLESISLPGAAKITNTDVMAVLKGCKKASFLDVSLTAANSDLVGQVAELLKNDFSRPKLTLVLHGICQHDGVTNPEPERLQLSFKAHAQEPSQFYFDRDDLQFGLRLFDLQDDYDMDDLLFDYYDDDDDDDIDFDIDAWGYDPYDDVDYDDDDYDLGLMGCGSPDHDYDM